MMSAAKTSSHTPAGGQHKIQVQTVDMKLGIMGHRVKNSPLLGTYQSHKCNLEFPISLMCILFAWEETQVRREN